MVHQNRAPLENLWFCPLRLGEGPDLICVPGVKSTRIPPDSSEYKAAGMAIKPPPPPWEVLDQIRELVGGSDFREEADKNFRALAQSALGRLDVVSREEFDAQAEALRRTRERVAELEQELEAMTRELEALAGSN